MGEGKRKHPTITLEKDARDGKLREPVHAGLAKLLDGQNVMDTHPQAYQK